MVSLSWPSERRMTLATALVWRRPSSTLAATSRPSRMLVFPCATRASTARLAIAFPSSDMRMAF
uniref:Uncharacterized protein n=1 Tax=Oryza glumipatula TaxID=40148 RepID=A0A0E0BQ59_9ORYZ